MSNKFDEDFVTYSIKEFLIENLNNPTIVQYHPPGGQANFGVVMSNKEVIYLDIIAIEGKKIMMFENKASFCLSDILKLHNLSKDKSALEQIVNYTSNCISTKLNFQEITFQFYHGHMESKKSNEYGYFIGLALVGKDGTVRIEEKHE